MPKIILASSSPYRKMQLEQLDIAFEAISPEIDETPLRSENAKALSLRLAESKARAIGNSQTGLIIGSDQAAQFKDRIIGKPGSIENAVANLAEFSGNKVIFYTSVAVLNTEIDQLDTICVETHVHFRTLTQQQIKHYVAEDNPIDCAGSFKIEQRGIVLFEKVSSDDPSALVGLPMIATISLLTKHGVNLFAT